MLSAAALTLREILSPPFRSVLWKSLGLTVLLLVAAWAGLQALAAWLVDVASYPWLDTAVAILTGFGILIGLAFLIAPVTTLFAGIFADEIAERVEQTHYVADPPGRAVPLAQAAAMSVKFFAVVVLVNLVVLALLFLPGINLVAFFLANGYLLGREYFEAAAARFRPVAEARALRQAHAGRVFAAGLVIAVFLAVPLLNLLTPLFATAFMVHVHKGVTRRATVGT